MKSAAKTRLLAATLVTLLALLTVAGTAVGAPRSPAAKWRPAPIPKGAAGAEHGVGLLVDATAAGLRDDLIRLGLTAHVGSGGSNLSATARRRIALARAMLKRPTLLILDGIAATASRADEALRAAIREDLPESMIVFAAASAEAGADADLIVTIDAAGAVRSERRRSRQPDAPQDSAAIEAKQEGQSR
jgi:hypothetical protein